MISTAVADTSGLLAMFNSADPEHEPTVAAASRCGLLVVTALALTEVHHVASVRASRTAADAILRTIVRRTEADRIRIAATTPDQLRTALTIRSRYESLDLDIVDAVNVAVAAEFRTNLVVTLDRRDFRAMLPLTDHRSFRLLPDDA